MEQQKDHQHAGFTAGEDALITEKLNDLISAIETADPDGTTIRNVQVRFEKALSRFEGFERREPAAHAGDFLQHYQLNSKAARRYRIGTIVNRVVRMVTALLLVCLGFGMIIMPAPPYFEMFTLFYLNPNDGVTIMDVISLIVAFCGVSLFISSLIKLRSS